MTYQDIRATIIATLSAIGGTASVSDLHAALRLRGFVRFSLSQLRTWLTVASRYSDLSLSDEEVVTA